MKMLLLSSSVFDYVIMNQIDKQYFDVIRLNSNSIIEITNCIRNNQINLCIIHTSFNAPNIYKIIGDLVNVCMIKTIYISNNMEWGQLYHVNQNPLFLLITELEVISLKTIVYYMEKVNYEISNLINKNHILEEKIKEEEYIKKAKVYLIKKGYQEIEAHRFIQQKSMNERVSKLHACERILRGE